MKSTFAAFFRSNRTLFAVAVLCVLMLKGFSYLGMASAVAKNPAGANHYFAAAVLGAHCSEEQGGNVPPGAPTHHSECCILCSGGTRDAALADILPSGSAIAVLTPRTAILTTRVSYPPQDPLLAVSTGLFSDWSATAPPAA